jgi:beta-glucosidase
VSETVLQFPADFRWGAATSAYQIEGAASADGRGPSIWDSFCQVPGKVRNGDNGDVACDHYNRFAEDVALLKSLNLNSYRFSIAWPRLFPNGTGKANSKGFDFYDRLLDKLSQNNLEPHVTLFHWDLPEALQGGGGWQNRDTAKYFADYAAACVERYGDRIKHWTTINEPWVIANLGYRTGEMAPGLCDERASIEVSHNLLLGHGMAADAIRAASKEAKVGIVNIILPTYPLHENAQDRACADEHWKKDSAWFIEPILLGRYPQCEQKRMETLDSIIRAGDMEIISRPIDFLGINYYFRQVFSQNGVHKSIAGANYTAMDWEIYPEGLSHLLTKLHGDYQLPPVYITENGAAFDDMVTAEGRVNDSQRIDYLHNHLAALHAAISAGVNVAGYFCWSLLDNFEWAYGYSKRFGLVHVDFATLKRTPKDSAHWYAQVAKENSLKAPSLVLPQSSLTL